MDIKSYALGFAMGKKKGGSGGGGKDPILTELVVTENGVYDEPVVGGGAVEIAVGKTIQFKETITFPDNTMSGDEPLLFYKDSAWQWLIMPQGGSYLLSGSEPGLNHAGYVYADSMIAPMLGLTASGWYKVDAVAQTLSPCDPPFITIEDGQPNPAFTNIEMLTSIGDSWFQAPSTPADGWNKVTVNVAGDIVDVPELPTENIEEGKIYRIFKEGETTGLVWLNLTNMASMAGEAGEIMQALGLKNTFVYHIVDELPETLNSPLIDENGNNVTDAYILKDTGHAYLVEDEGDGNAYLVAFSDLGVGDFKGLISDSSEATEDGVYSIITSSEPSTTYGIPNAHPVKRFVDGAWVELA